MKTFAFAFFFTALASLHAATVAWNNTAGGNWSNPANWTPNQVPTSSDTAIITASGNYTVTLDAAATVAGLALGAGDNTIQVFSLNQNALSVNGNVTVNSGGDFRPDGGIFNGTNGGAIYSGALVDSWGQLAGTITFTEDSVVTLTGPLVTNALSRLNVLTNYGTINWTNTDLYGRSGLQIYNYGLWDAQTNNTFYGAGATFNNYGTFLKSFGPASGYSLLDDNLTFNNFGIVNDGMGGLGIYHGTGTGSFSSAANSDIFFKGTTPYILTGNIYVNGPGYFQGKITGSNAVVNGTMTCPGDLTLAGILTLANSSALNLAGIFSNGLPISFNGVLLTNYGTVAWSNIDVGSLSQSTIYNYGLWDARTNNTFYGVNFYNYGTFRKSGGVYTSPSAVTSLDYLTALFTNYGIVDVQVGHLSIGFGGGNGSFNNATNTMMDFAGLTLFGDTFFNGAGQIMGNLYGNATLHGVENISSINLSGAFTLANDNVLNLGAFSLTGILTNYGTANWYGAGFPSSGKIYNYGVWDAKTNATMSGIVFNNSGTFRKSDGANLPPTYNTSLGSFTNYGIVDVETGALWLTSGGGNGSFYTATNAVTLFSSFTLSGDPTFSGPGWLNGELGGNANLHGTENVVGANLSGTLTLANDNVLNLLALTPTAFNSTLTNYGTVNWYYNGYNLSGSGGKIVNYNLWDAKTNAQMSGVTFNNLGTFRKSGGTGLTYLNTTFTNYGILDVEIGLAAFYQAAGNGSFYTATNAISDFQFLSLWGDPVFSGPGHLLWESIGGNAVLHGTENLEYGQFTGPLTLANDNVLNLLSYYYTSFNAPLTNNGTVNWYYKGYNLLGSAGTIYNYGLWDAKTNAQMSGVAFNNYGTFRKSEGAILPPNYSMILDSSCTFTNYGILDIEIGIAAFGNAAGNGSFYIATNAIFSPNTLSLWGDPAFSGSGHIVGANMSGNAVLHGTEAVESGQFAGGLTFANDNVLNLLPFDSFNFIRMVGNQTNYGTVNWRGAGNINNNFNPGPSVFYNYGLWDSWTNATMYYVTFNNYGTFRKSGGTWNGDSGMTTIDGTSEFNNSGLIENQIGLLDLYQGTDTGTVNSATNARVVLGELFGYNFNLVGNVTFGGSGGTFAGHWTGSNAVINGTVPTTFVSLYGTFTIANDSLLLLSCQPEQSSFVQNSVFHGTVLTNYGTISWMNGDIQCGQNPQIFNYGLWEAKTNKTLYGGYFGGITTFNNYGTFRKSDGVASGFPYSATIFDTNTIFHNDGLTDLQIGQLAINGTADLVGGTLNFGINNSNNFGSLNFFGTANFAGNLSVNFNNAYSPATSNSFALITYGSKSGTFSGISLPPLSPTLRWVPDYSTNTFILHVIAHPPLQLTSMTSPQGANFQFSWSGGIAENYQVQYTTNLAIPNWLDLGDIITGTNGTMTASDAIAIDPQKFYRLVQLP